MMKTSMRLRSGSKGEGDNSDETEDESEGKGDDEDETEDGGEGPSQKRSDRWTS